MTTTLDIEQAIYNRISELDASALRKSYLDQDEFLVIEDFLSPEIMEEWGKQLEGLKPLLHRSFIPKHKKGGSVSYDFVNSRAPAMSAVYHSPALLALHKKVPMQR
jgi:hypothetical protein